MRCSLVVLVVTVVTLGLTGRRGEGKTIDLEEAVLRVPPALNGHASQAYDLFGYSGALHHTLDPRSGSGLAAKLDGARLMVGVPNGTIEGGPVDRPGVVFSCPLRASGSGPCLAAEGNLYDNTPNTNLAEGGSSEEKQGQQMGFSMRSDGEQLVACAPGWISVYQSTNYIQGRCLRVNKNFTEESYLEPCTQDRRNTQHNPAINDDSPQGFGQCFTGISVDIINDGVLVFGAPGAFLYTGTAVVNASDTLAVSNNMESPPLPRQGFLGVAIARGRILDKDRDAFVIGSAHGSGLLGQVRVMRPNVVSTAMGFILENVVTVLEGDLVGAQFGAALATADFDGDGYHEVVVGAPFYFISARQPERGAVYVYPNSGGNVSDSNRTRIVGEVTSARFGYALTALGDLDGDGCHELAVGAPYGEGLPGTVFIYSGGKGNPIPVLSQTIVGSELNLERALLDGLTSFGAFVEGNTDIDGNCYNDLVVGAFQSRKMFVLRSRSVVVLTAEVTTSVTVLTVGATNFSVEYCLRASGRCLAQDLPVAVNYTLYADRQEGGRQPRVVFMNNSAPTVMGNLTLAVDGDPECVRQTAILQNANVDIQTVPIVPAIDAAVLQGPKPAAGDGVDVRTDLMTDRLYSRLVGNTSTSLIGERECGDDGVCQFDLRFQSIRVKEPTDARVLLGFNLQVAVQAVVESAGNESAFSPTVAFSIPKGMTFRSVDNPSVRRCSSRTSDSVDCILVGVIRPNTTVSVTIYFSVSANEAEGGTNATIAAVILSPSVSGVMETNTSNNRASVQVVVVAAADVLVTTMQQDVVFPVVRDSPRQTQLPLTFGQIGRNVSVTFNFLSRGPSKFSSGLLTLHVPFRSGCTRSPFLFYLASVTVANDTEDLPVSNCSYDPMVDILDLGGEPHRNLPMVELPCVDGGRVNCSSSSRCATVQCMVHSVKSRDEASITLSGYVDDHYFSDTSVGTTLEFLAEYSITDESVEEGDLTNNQRTVIVEVRVESLPPTSAPVPWWAIAVPIAVAVLLIIAVFVVLYILGFFKRKRPGDKTALVDEDNAAAAAEGEGEAGPEESGDKPTAAELQDGAVDDTEMGGSENV